MPNAGDVVRASDLNPFGCRVYETGAQSIPDNTLTALTFTSERFDTDSMHDTVTNNSRITINSAGIYLVGGAMRIANGSDYASLSLRVRLGGTTDIVHSDLLVSAGATTPQVKHVVTVYRLAAGDYLELLVLQDNTANAARNTVIGGPLWPEFWAIRQAASI